MSKHTSEPLNKGTGRPLQARVFADLRLRRQAAAVHRLGVRALYELLAEVRRHHPAIAADLDYRVARYAAADPEVLAAVGADRMPAMPVRLIGGAP